MYDQALLTHFALIGDKLSKGVYEEAIPTSSQILSKLELERLVLVLRTLFIHITSRIHQNCDRIFPFFFVQMCTQMRFSVYVATPMCALARLGHWLFIICDKYRFCRAIDSIFSYRHKTSERVDHGLSSDFCCCSCTEILKVLRSFRNSYCLRKPVLLQSYI